MRVCVLKLAAAWIFNPALEKLNSELFFLVQIDWFTEYSGQKLVDFEF